MTNATKVADPAQLMLRTLTKGLNVLEKRARMQGLCQESGEGWEGWTSSGRVAVLIAA